MIFFAHGCLPFASFLYKGEATLHRANFKKTTKYHPRPATGEQKQKIMNYYQTPYYQQVQPQEIIPYGQGQYQQPYGQGQYYQPYGQAPAYLADECEDNDKTNVFLAILSFLIPLVGWILAAVNKYEKPNAARTYSLCAWIAFVLNIIFRLISFVS